MKKHSLTKRQADLVSRLITASYNANAPLGDIDELLTDVSVERLSVAMAERAWKELAKHNFSHAPSYREILEYVSTFYAA